MFRLHSAVVAVQLVQAVTDGPIQLYGISTQLYSNPLLSLYHMLTSVQYDALPKWLHTLIRVCPTHVMCMRWNLRHPR